MKGLGKKFRKEWIFRSLNFTFQNNLPTAIVGPNGSGKTTLLQIISGFLPSSEGLVKYEKDNNLIEPEDYYRYVSVAAPYLELVEELTAMEFLRFHFSFEEMKPGMCVEDFLEKTSLTQTSDKYIRHFSSGMKTRLKLGLCFYGQSSVLLLDEPTSNLDSNGVDWYHQNIIEARKDRLLIICSNQQHEYQDCQQIIDLGALENLNISKFT